MSNNEQKMELTAEQITFLLQIINRGTFIGRESEIITILKQTLLLMLQQKQSATGVQQQQENKPAE